MATHDPTQAVEKFGRAVRKAKKQWDKLHDCQVLFLEAFNRLTPKEKMAYCGTSDGRKAFGDIGA